MNIGLGFKPDLVIPVGDMHVRKEDIPEAEKFIKWLVANVIAFNTKDPKALVRAVLMFMGDQYHLFGVKNVEVEKFWTWAFTYIHVNLGYPALGIIGNHDMNQEETANSMDVHNDHVHTIGAEGMMLTPTVGVVGFIRNEDLFHAKVMELYNAGARKVFCHADFDGAQFESGYYSPHGFKLDRYPADLNFFSGHVHLKQEFGNIYYFGTPRHLTKSDIDEKKGVHLMDLNTGFMLFSPTPQEVWSPFVRVDVIEGSEGVKDKINLIENYAREFTSPSRIYAHITGTKEYVKKTERSLPGGIKISSTYTDEDSKPAEIRESEGIPVTFHKFSVDFFQKNNVPADIQAEVLERVHKLCPSLKQGST